MSTKMNLQSLMVKVSLCLIASFIILALSSCSSTSSSKSSTGLGGTRDEIDIQHYKVLKAAIEAKSKNDALAVLALMQSDATRWHTDILTVMNALVDNAALTELVESEDWVSANKKFKKLSSKYQYE